MSTLSKIKTLTQQLYPKGRAFWMPVGGFFDKLHDGLAISEARLIDDALSTLDSAIPDNDNFNEGDALQWERRLGLITNELVSLANRKLAIKQKMAHPGTILGRQHYLFLERELQAAGFDVYVYENRFASYPDGYETQGPLVVSGGIGGISLQHGQVQHGQRRHGVSFGQIIANSIDNEIDLNFNIGSNLRATFFIGGNPIGTFANVDAERESEFRQLILRVKPVHMVGYLLINYV